MGGEANRETIERFYEAFGQCNGAAMTACYAPDAHFCDPAFGDLHGADIGAVEDADQPRHRPEDRAARARGR